MERTSLGGHREAACNSCGSRQAAPHALQAVKTFSLTAANWTPRGSLDWVRTEHTEPDVLLCKTHKPISYPNMGYVYTSMVTDNTIVYLPWSANATDIRPPHHAVICSMNACMLLAAAHMQGLKQHQCSPAEFVHAPRPCSTQARRPGSNSADLLGQLPEIKFGLSVQQSSPPVRPLLPCLSS